MIYCFGNSQVAMFSGQDMMIPTWPHVASHGYDAHPNIKTYHIGAMLAYTFSELYLASILEIINSIKFDKENDYILLVIGEIDCRWHLPRRAEEQGKNDIEITNEWVNRYFNGILELKNQGYKTIIFGMFPSTAEGHFDAHDKKIYKNVEIRNKYCRLWNESMSKLCNENNIKFFHIYDYVTDDNGNTNMDCFKDYCHLKPDFALPIIIKELNKIGIEV